MACICSAQITVVLDLSKHVDISYQFLVDRAQKEKRRAAICPNKRDAGWHTNEEVKEDEVWRNGEDG